MEGSGNNLGTGDRLHTHHYTERKQADAERDRQRGSAPPRTRRILGGIGVGMVTALAACSDAPNSPSGPSVAFPGAPISRIDGRMLDYKRLERLRAIGEGCTFTVQDLIGLQRRAAMPRHLLPFDLRRIAKDPSTGLGDGKIMTGRIAPDGVGAILITCLVPGNMSIDEFGTALAASHGNRRWHDVLEQLSRKRPVIEEQLRRPLSPEAREFLYEMAPSVVIPLSGPRTGDEVEFTFAHSSDIPSGCRWGVMMTTRDDFGMMMSSEDLVDCVCRPTYLVNTTTGERTEQSAECFRFVVSGGSPSWPSYNPYSNLGAISGGYAQDADDGSDPGGWTPPPENCDDPEPEIPEDSLGRQYFRALSSCEQNVPTYTISIVCSPQTVVRGATVTCTATPNQGTMQVDAWGFVPALNSLGHNWVSRTSSTWSGPLVTDGTVYMSGAVDYVWTAGAPADVNVVPRSSFAWGPGDWSHLQGMADVRPTPDEPSGTTSGNAHMCPYPSCTATLQGHNRYIGPDVNQLEGFTQEQIQSGPNAGLYYITGSTYRFQSASAMRAGFAQNWSTAYVTSGSDLAACRALPNNANIGPYINWWDYNSRCQGVNPATIIQAMWNHEREHHMQGERVAAANDPRKAIEDVVAADIHDLVARVQARVIIANALIDTATDPEPQLVTLYPYFYDPATNTWTRRSWII